VTQSPVAVKHNTVWHRRTGQINDSKHQTFTPAICQPVQVNN